MERERRGRDGDVVIKVVHGRCQPIASWTLGRGRREVLTSEDRNGVCVHVIFSLFSLKF